MLNNSKLIVICLAIVLFASALTAAKPGGKLPPLDPSPPKAIFALTNTCNWVLVKGKRKNLFNYDVDGVVNYMTWRMVEPMEGKFRYPGLDRMLSEAVKADKYLSYNILAGMHAPDWVYEKIKQKPFIWKQTNGINRKTYLPWITVDGKRTLNTPFLKVWKNTILNFSEYIYHHPHRDRISYIAITGWPTANGLELMLPLSYEEMQQINWNAEAKKLYVEFGKKCVDIFIEAFPDFPLGIAYTDWFGGNKDGSHCRSTAEINAIINYALMRAKLKGITMVPMGLWLAHKNVVSNPNHPLMKEMVGFKAKASAIAFEGPMGSYNSKWYLPLEQQIKNAIKADATWVQFWHHDITQPEHQVTLSKYQKIFHKQK